MTPADLLEGLLSECLKMLQTQTVGGHLAQKT